MANEINRKQYRLRITDPNDRTSFVDVPVTWQIQFRDPRDRGQDFIWTINNGATSNRLTHTKTVKNASISGGGVTLDDSNSLNVERIDAVLMRDPRDRGQDRLFRIMNNDPPPQVPGGSNATDPAHFRTHCVRYTADNTKDGTPWIDVELIDQLRYRDPRSRGQDYVYSLINPSLGEAVNDDTDPYAPTLEIVDQALNLVEDDGSQGINPPWRLDPFRNIVNVNWTGINTVCIFGTSTTDNRTNIVGLIRVTTNGVTWTDVDLGVTTINGNNRFGGNAISGPGGFNIGVDGNGDSFFYLPLINSDTSTSLPIISYDGLNWSRNDTPFDLTSPPQFSGINPPPLPAEPFPADPFTVGANFPIRGTSGKTWLNFGGTVSGTTGYAWAYINGAWVITKTVSGVAAFPAAIKRTKFTP